MPRRKGMRGCHRLCRHREWVEDYYRERHAQFLRVEEATHGWDTEIEEYFKTVEEPVTLKRWMIQTKGRNET